MDGLLYLMFGGEPRLTEIIQRYSIFDPSTLAGFSEVDDLLSFS
jgi:hypothetical protein